MLKKVLGDLLMSGMMKRLRGGPQSMLPMSPGKGSGVPSLKGVTPHKPRQYVTPQQNPFLNKR